MRRRTIGAFCAALMLLAGGSAAAKSEMVSEPELPVVIDRSADASAWPDFSFPEDAQLLEIWMPDIRDADAAILTFGGEVWMIDCGDVRAAKRLVILMRQLGIERVDRLFNSHPHHDHLNGLEMTADTAEIGELLICFPENATEHMKQAMTVCADRGIPVTAYEDGDTFAMGDGAVTLQIRQETQAGLSMNDMSALTMVRYGERSMLFTADVEKPGQRALLADTDAAALRADILKYPHHGKLTLEDAFLAAVSPELVVITNYRQFGESYPYLTNKKIPIVYTNRDKIFLHLATDGRHWLCEYVPIKK